MAINSNVVSHFFHFRPDDDWSIQSKRRQSFFSELKLVTDNLLFMQQPTEKPMKVYSYMYLLVCCLTLNVNNKSECGNRCIEFAITSNESETCLPKTTGNFLFPFLPGYE